MSHCWEGWFQAEQTSGSLPSTKFFPHAEFAFETAPGGLGPVVLPSSRSSNIFQHFPTLTYIYTSCTMTWYTDRFFNVFVGNHLNSRPWKTQQVELSFSSFSHRSIFRSKPLRSVTAPSVQPLTKSLHRQLHGRNRRVFTEENDLRKQIRVKKCNKSVWSLQFPLQHMVTHHDTVDSWQFVGRTCGKMM